MPIIGNLSSAGKKPTTPTIGTATDGGTGTSANVAFTASSYIGKGTITYTALSNPGSITGTGSASPIAVSGLTTGTAYTFTVKGDTNYGVASDYSAASNSVTPASPSSYESISTVTVGSGGSASITFSSIPATYTHLQLRIAASASAVGNFRMTFNSDTGSNYAWHQLYGTGASALASAGASQSNMVVGYDNKANISFPAAAIIDILDYANTNKYKTTRSLSGTEQNTSDGLILFRSGLWMNTNAVSTIAISLDATLTFNQYSSFALYGIKG